MKWDKNKRLFFNSSIWKYVEYGSTLYSGSTWFHGEYIKETMMLIARGTEDNHLILVEKTKLLLRHKCTARDLRFKNKAFSDYKKM